MTAYIIRRAIQGAIILWLATLVLYFLLGQVPGSAYTRLLNPDANAGKTTYTMADVHRLERLMGWDKPWYQRYFVWLFDPNKVRPDDHPIDIRLGGFRLRGSGFLTGNWGMSMTVANGYPALELIKSRLPNTLILMGSSIIVSLLIAFPIGIISAVRQYSRLDYTLTTFSFFGLSLPSFWLGIMLIILFAVTFKQWGLPYLPPGGLSDYGYENNIFNRIWHLILPVTVLSIISIAGWSRYIRSSMLEVLGQDYVRTAWAKGLQPRTVILKHALRNALIPLLTVVGLTLPSLFGGAIVVESVFAYPGMGQLYRNALNYDWTLLLDILVITTVLVVTANTLTDILYAFVDPRIRYS
jgi:peptide/nickel transport system permease protein